MSMRPTPGLGVHVMITRQTAAALVVVCLGAAACDSAEPAGALVDASSEPTDALVNASPVVTSQYHQPASTWWGHNMSKLVRDGSFVYIGIVENDSRLQADASPRANASFNLYGKEDGGSFSLLATVPASRPGNVLLDSRGGLHLIVFEATDPATNDSAGRLVHYEFSAARSGDFRNPVATNITDERVPSDQSPNIRVGAAIADNDDMAVAFGVPSFRATGDRAQFAYVFDSETRIWTERSVQPVDHEFYYPYVAFDASGAALALSVMDDYNLVGDDVINTYYRIDLFRFRDDSVDEKVLVDYTSHPLAQNYVRPQLVEQSDLFVDVSGTIHAIYKEKLDPASDSIFSDLVYCAGGFDVLECRSMPSWVNANANWARLFEINNELYAFLSSWDSHFVTKLGSGRVVKLDVTTETGVYPYVDAARGGTDRDADAVDVYLVSGSSIAYPGATSIVITLKKDDIARLF
jgi:hypothetical protein